MRVPEYSPHAVAEHAVALVLALNRELHRAHSRVREGNFSLESLVGFDLHGEVVGLWGTGRIGSVAARIFAGFGCRVVAHDLRPSEVLVRELGIRYVSSPELYRASDILSLHADRRAQDRAPRRRGPRRLRGRGGVFFQDLSDRVLQDDVLARLLTFPNVLITAHQEFLTRDALDHIATTTLGNVQAFERGGPLRNEVRAADVLWPTGGATA